MMAVKGDLPRIIINEKCLYEGNLKNYFKILFYRAQNLHHPYHNFRHTCDVLWWCYQACLFYRDMLYPREMRNLLVAAIFHDFNHSGRLVSDTINIQEAVKAFKMYALAEDWDNGKDIVELIQATQYPYEMPSEKLELRAQIIRDADLSQSINIVWIQQVIFGLAAEWKKEPIVVLEEQLKFYKKLKFCTQWAKEAFPESIIAEKISETQELLDILKD